MWGQGRKASSNVHESFSDVALLMLATFVFLLVSILITTRVQETVETPRLKEVVEQLEQEVATLSSDKTRLHERLDSDMSYEADAQMEQVLSSVGLESSKGRKDFDVFIEGLKHLPGKDLHLVVDATGSMHGAATFLVPLLRVISIRSGKTLSALTWFSDSKAETYTGSMGEIFDSFMLGAPFVGANETIGDVMSRITDQSPIPGAYVLLGDEPSDDTIYYNEIKAPVFPVAIGRGSVNTEWAYQTLADRTDGKLLKLRFQ